MITVTRENRVSMYLLLLAWTQSIIATMSCLMLVKEPLKAVIIILNKTLVVCALLQGKLFRQYPFYPI
jgi:hypothetical protein